MLLGPQMTDADLTALATQCPTVAVGRAGTAGSTGVLAADDQGLEAAVDHLASLGHQRIAFVDGPRGSIARARREGYREAMARHGYGVGADVLRVGSLRPTVRSGEAAALAASGRRPTASSPTTTGWRSACAMPLLRVGLRVPEDVSVVGYDDSPLARLGTIDLTSVSQEPEALADATVAVVATLLEAGPDERVADIVIPPRLVVRTSTGPPRSRE